MHANDANLFKFNNMKATNILRFSAILVFGAVMTMMSSCCDDESFSNSFDPSVDPVQTRVIADVPTAVMSSFDDNSMGAALVRRLSNTTTSLDENTKMVLIKGEDILNRPLTEWLEAAKIYLTGGYIAVEKPHNAHLVHLMEQLSTRFEQATYDILTKDDGSGVVVNIVPPNTLSSSNTINADAAKMKTRIANINALASTRSGVGDAAPVAEMVIFTPMSYYTCDPYQNRVVISSSSDSEEENEEVVSSEYTQYRSGLMADGAAQWLNSQQKATAGTRAMTRADGAGAINELMSASEEHTHQRSLMAKDWNGNSRHKGNGYLETVRVWGSHNMDTNKDYYYVQQKAVVAVGGKQKDDARLDVNKTLYAGPYEEDEYIDADWKNNGYHYKLYYGAWFSSGEFKLGLSGNGNIKLEDAIPTTDNNNTSTSVAVGETHSETNTVGFSLSAIISASPGANIGFNYSHGWTDGTTYTMTTTTNVKEIKVTKNTEGNTVIWKYQNSNDTEKIYDKCDEDEHILMPDAVVYDVNIDNQACWSVSNPEGAYTLKTNRVPKMQAYYLSGDNHEYLKNVWPSDGDGISYTLLIPNRSKQTWRMDVDFPELGQAGHEGQKGQLTDYLKQQFPDIYQPTIVLADINESSENTITYLVNNSKKLLNDPNALATLRGYAKDLGISEFTIKWYSTEGTHNAPEVKITRE